MFKLIKKQSAMGTNAILSDDQKRRVEELYDLFKDELTVEPSEKFTGDNVRKILDLALSRAKLSKTLQGCVVGPLNDIHKMNFNQDHPGYQEYMNPPLRSFA